MKSILKLPTKILYFCGCSLVVTGAFIFFLGTLVIDFSRDKEKK